MRERLSTSCTKPLMGTKLEREVAESVPEREEGTVGGEGDREEDGVMGDGSCGFRERRGLDWMTMLERDSAASATETEGWALTKKTEGMS